MILQYRHACINVLLVDNLASQLVLCLVANCAEMVLFPTTGRFFSSNFYNPIAS